MPDSKLFRLDDYTEDPACIAEDAELNRRIAAMGFAAYQRAKMNGAPVARYDRSLARLPRFIRLCDVCRIYDNSSAEPVCLFKKDGQRYAVSESENWSREQIVTLAEQGKRI